MASNRSSQTDELPPDNAARIVLFDALALDGSTAVDETSLFERVIPRLRVLVPRELHIHGERPYVATKIAACVDAEILQLDATETGSLRRGGRRPRIRYPDGSVRDYTPCLEGARERLDADEGRLREAKFDVHDVVGSIADDLSSDSYQRLVESMKEHGFLESCRILENRWGEVVDGRARSAAALEVGVEVKKASVPRHRDTPLQTVLLILDLNAPRLSGEQRAGVHRAIELATKRAWPAIEADLLLTQAWRRAEPKKYHAILEVTLHPFREGEPPAVQVTNDGSRVLLRSLTDQVGLGEWSRNDIRPYVSFEQGRSPVSGPRAIFVNMLELIQGIDRMQADRRRRRRKVHHGWDTIREWLVAFTDRSKVGEAERPSPPGDGGTVSSG